MQFEKKVFVPVILVTTVIKIYHHEMFIIVEVEWCDLNDGKFP